MRVRHSTVCFVSQSLSQYDVCAPLTQPSSIVVHLIRRRSREGVHFLLIVKVIYMSCSVFSVTPAVAYTVNCYTNAKKLTVDAIPTTHQTHVASRCWKPREALGTGEPGDDSTEHTVPSGSVLTLALVLNSNSTHWISNQASCPVSIRPEKVPPLLQRLKIIMLSASGTFTSVSADCAPFMYHALFPGTQSSL